VKEPAAASKNPPSYSGLYFFDTSALIKRYQAEAGSDIVDQIFDGPDCYVYISSFSLLEIASALDRKNQEKLLSQDDLSVILERFWADMKANRRAIVEVHSSHIKLARNFILAHHLRAPDALILAQSMILKSWPEEEGAFVCSDLKLLTAAQALGQRVLNPDDPFAK
jgi:predicted nucleic acid-binding protein